MAKLPKSLTRVTWFSKSIALLVALAFFASAFYAGMQYQKQTTNLISNITPTPTAIPGVTGNQFACSKDSDCVLTTDTVESSCCPNIKCLRDSNNSIIAVNESWLTSAKNTVCAGQRMCPMIMMMCAKNIVEENSHYSAKCVMHVCQKIKS